MQIFQMQIFVSLNIMWRNDQQHSKENWLFCWQSIFFWASMYEECFSFLLSELQHRNFKMASVWHSLYPIYASSDKCRDTISSMCFIQCGETVTWAQSDTAFPERWLRFSADLYSWGPLPHGAVKAAQYQCPAGGWQFPLTRGSGPSTALHFLTPSRRSWKPANGVKLTALCKQNTNREQIKITLSIYANAGNYWMKSHRFHIRHISMCRRFNILAHASLAY